ncbi:MAG: hypothetical protein IJG86_01985 [Clostridia bacterium]|nr:hypothetical protein [Clostridia bacterium]
MTGEILQAAEKAERDIETIDDVLYHLGEIKEALQGSDTRTADSLCVIDDMIDTAKGEKTELETIVAQADTYERRAAEREYYESL